MLNIKVTDANGKEIGNWNRDDEGRLVAPQTEKFDLNGYQGLAVRTLAASDSGKEQLAILSLGVGGESGEFQEHIELWLIGEEILNYDLLKKELGDILWYLACVSYSIGFKLQDAAAINLGRTDNYFDLNLYQETAYETVPEAKSIEMRLSVLSLRLGSRSGKLQEHVKKWLGFGHELNVYKVNSYIGEVIWAIACICESLGFDLNEVAEKNIEKLKRRYPEGFSHERSINRAENDT